jgi:hypothetical protein
MKIEKITPVISLFVTLASLFLVGYQIRETRKKQREA